MKELGAHILDLARQLECEILDDESGEKTTPSTTECFQVLLRCMWIIEPSAKQTLNCWPLPQNVAARFKSAQALAESIKNLGIKREFGYQILLYGSFKEIAPIILDVVEFLPKNPAVPDNARSFRNTILEKALKNMEPAWIPDYCRRFMMQFNGIFWCPHDVSIVSPFVAKNFDESAGCSDSREWIPALKRPKFPLQGSEEISKDSTKPKPICKPKLPPKPSALVKNKHIEEKKAHLAHYKALIENTKKDLLSVRCANILAKEQLQKSIKKINAQDKRWIKVLKNPIEAEQKMQQALRNAEDKNKRHIEVFERARAERMEQLKAKTSQSQLSIDLRQVAAEIVAAKQERASLKEQFKAESKYVELLTLHLERLKLDSDDRKAYTKRTYEVIDNISRQDSLISETNSTILQLHKKIRWLEQNVERTNSIIHDALQKESSVHHKGMQAFRLANKIYQTCSLAVGQIKSAGVSIRAVEEITDKIEIAKQSSVDQKLRQALTDLEAIQEEVKRLQSVLNNVHSVA